MSHRKKYRKTRALFEAMVDRKAVRFEWLPETETLTMRVKGYRKTYSMSAVDLAAMMVGQMSFFFMRRDETIHQPDAKPRKQQRKGDERNDGATDAHDAVTEGGPEASPVPAADAPEIRQEPGVAEGVDAHGASEHLDRAG